MDDITEEVSQYGEVVSVEVPRSDDGMGYAFVNYKDKSVAEKVSR